MCGLYRDHSNLLLQRTILRYSTSYTTRDPTLAVALPLIEFEAHTKFIIKVKLRVGPNDV
jgi:hypothetical protein